MRFLGRYIEAVTRGVTGNSPTKENFTRSETQLATNKLPRTFVSSYCDVAIEVVDSFFVCLLRTESLSKKTITKLPEV